VLFDWLVLGHVRATGNNEELAKFMIGEIPHQRA
jgi:hypothetical protein